ncbi:MAG: formylglycine-generating enzyme family protein [Bacteroidota bacterium]
MKHILAISFLFLSLTTFSQTIENVTFQQEGKDIIVYYDLQAEEGAKCEVSLYYSFNGGRNFYGPCESVTGDVGDVTPAYGRQIRWSAFQELGDLSTSSFMVRVRGRYTAAPKPKEGVSGTLKDLPWTPEMVLIKGGTFTMGSPEREEGRDSDETQHQVALSDYYIGKYEVTVADFQKFIADTGHQTDAEKGDGSYIWDGGDWNKKSGINWRHDEEGKLRPKNEYNRPVIHVSWNDAQAYCQWLSRKTGKTYTLPTEAQWEYAARSRGQAVKYAWGNQAPNGQKGGNVADQAAKKKFTGATVFDDYEDGYVYASPIGRFLPNDSGLYDMTGNVYEWCQDWYVSDYYTTCKREGTVQDPTGPVSGDRRVIRGGSWYNAPQHCRVAHRDYYSPSLRSSHIGFRLSRHP